MTRHFSELLDRLTRTPAISRLRAILVYSALDFTELALAWTIGIWGAWLVMPWTSISPAMPTMSYVTQIAPAEAWGVVALLIGWLQAYAVSSDRRRLRHLALMVSFLFWFWVSLLFLMLHPGSPHAPVYGALAAVCAWCVLRNAVFDP